MDGLIGLLVTLALGALGGNLAGFILKDKSLGTLWNSVIGILGGGLGYYLLGLVGLSVGIGLIGRVVASFIGGAVLLFIVSLFRKS